MIFPGGIDHAISNTGAEPLLLVAVLGRRRSLRRCASPDRAAGERRVATCRSNSRGKTVIVTGAAHGFGRAISLAFAQRGAHVWACDVLADELAETQQLVPARPAGPAKRGRST